LARSFHWETDRVSGQASFSVCIIALAIGWVLARLRPSLSVNFCSTVV